MKVKELIENLEGFQKKLIEHQTLYNNSFPKYTGGMYPVTNKHELQEQSLWLNRWWGANQSIINQFRDRTTIQAHSTEDEWNYINAFGRKINFVKDKFKREIIFRDIEHAYFFAQNGFNKPAIILAGGVMEELLRFYLIYKKINPLRNSFEEYIKSCETKGLLKKGISRLSDSLRNFRNIVHLEKEESSRYTISKATAKGAISAIFTISNDF